MWSTEIIHRFSKGATAVLKCCRRLCHAEPGPAVPQKPVNVCVEGNIGSGKTTFLKHFKDFDSHVELVDEPVEHWRDFGGDNPLARLYEDPERWAMTFHSLATLTLLQRHSQPQTKPLRIMERSLFSTQYCFTENLRQRGVLSDIEYAILIKWFDYVIEQYQVKVDLVVYLQTSPEVCLQRIHRRNRPEEQIVSMEYLRHLHTLHENWLIKPCTQHVIRPPVMIINGDQDIKTIQTEFSQVKTQILSQLRQMPG